MQVKVGAAMQAMKVKAAASTQDGNLATETAMKVKVGAAMKGGKFATEKAMHATA